MVCLSNRADKNGQGLNANEAVEFKSQASSIRRSCDASQNRPTSDGIRWQDPLHLIPIGWKRHNLWNLLLSVPSKCPYPAALLPFFLSRKYIILHLSELERDTMPGWHLSTLHTKHALHFTTLDPLTNFRQFSAEGYL